MIQACHHCLRPEQMGTPCWPFITDKKKTLQPVYLPAIFVIFFVAEIWSLSLPICPPPHATPPPKKSVIRTGCLGSVPGRLLLRLAADGPLFLPRSLSLADTFILEINIGRDNNCILYVFFGEKYQLLPLFSLASLSSDTFWMFLEAARSKHLESLLIYQPSECWPVIPKLFQLFGFRFLCSSLLVWQSQNEIILM